MMSKVLLIVGGNERCKQILGTLPEYSVIAAENGAAAIALLKQDSLAISAVLLDMTASPAEGEPVLRAMRSDPVLAALPVLAMTDGAEGGAERDALRLGASDVIRSPIEPAVLRRRLQNLLQFQTIIDNLNSGISANTFVNGAVEFIYANNAFYRMYGYTKEQWDSEVPNALELILPEDRDCVLEIVDRIYRTGNRDGYEYRCHTRDGGIVWVHVVNSLISLAGFEEKVLLAISTNVTAQHEAEKKARDTASQLQAIMENINGGISAVTMDERGQVHFVIANDQYYSMLGYTKEQFKAEVKNGVADRVYPADAELFRDARSRVKQDDKVTAEFRVIRRDGSVAWLRSRSSLCSMSGIADDVYLSIFFDITGEKESVEALHTSEAEYRLAIEGSDKYIYRYIHKDNSVILTGKVVELFGCNDYLTDVPESLIQKSMVAEESIRQYRDFFHAIKRGDRTGRMTICRKTQDGRWRWYAGYFSNIFDASGTPLSAVVVFDDVTEQREKEAVYQNWQQTMEGRAPEAFSLYRWNLSQNKLFGDIQGSLLFFRKNLGDLSFAERTDGFVERYVHPDDRGRYRALVDADMLMESYRRGIRKHTMEYRGLMPDGRMLWLRLTVEVFVYQDNADVCAYLMYEDIDSVKRAELLLRETATLDPLTRTLNRSAFSAKVNKLMDEGEPCAFLMIDLDDFKQINDVLGHGVGDQALMDLVKAIRSTLRSTDLLGRLGGDEFMVCLPGIASEKLIEKKANQIVSIAYKIYDLGLHSSVSIGIAMAPRDGTRFEELYHKADKALYRVKNTTKNGALFYNDSLDANGE